MWFLALYGESLKAEFVRGSQVISYRDEEKILLIYRREEKHLVIFCLLGVKYI